MLTNFEYCSANDSFTFMLAGHDSGCGRGFSWCSLGQPFPENTPWLPGRSNNMRNLLMCVSLLYTPEQSGFITTNCMSLFNYICQVSWKYPSGLYGWNLKKEKENLTLSSDFRKTKFNPDLRNSLFPVFCLLVFCFGDMRLWFSNRFGLIRGKELLSNKLLFNTHTLVPRCRY